MTFRSSTIFFSSRRRHTRLQGDWSSDVCSSDLSKRSMWSLGRSYGIRMALFEGHRLVTEGPYRVVRHPMYLGILSFHIGAIFALQSLLLLAATALYVVPFTAVRIVAEERVLLQGFGDAYVAFVRRVPALVPFAR